MYKYILLQIDSEQVSTGGYDETDAAIDEAAAQRRKNSGWWGDQTWNTYTTLSKDDLKEVLSRKSNCSDLGSSGVYLYQNKENGKVYFGIAAEQSLLDRQAQHLNSASHTDGRQVGKFDRALSRLFDETQWDFLAKPMSDRQEIHEEERNLVLQYKSYLDQYGYNTQIPGGQ